MPLVVAGVVIGAAVRGRVLFGAVGAVAPRPRIWACCFMIDVRGAAVGTVPRCGKASPPPVPGGVVGVVWSVVGMVTRVGGAGATTPVWVAGVPRFRRPCSTATTVDIVCVLFSPTI